MAKFDENRPYGECSPVENGLVYWQAPNFFDQSFNHVNAKGEVLEYAEGNKAPPLRTKKVPSVDEAMVPITEEVAATDETNLPTEGVDLLAWAKGDVKGVPFFTIRKKMVEDGYESPDTAIAAKDAIMARLG